MANNSSDALQRMVLPVFATGGIDLKFDDAPEDLGPVLKEMFSARIRRIGRFIQLALIGAGRCVDGRELPKNTKLFLASGVGDIAVTEKVLERIVRDRQAPKPLDFINTVSNAACFYMARQFDIHGSSCTVSRSRLPMQALLRMALQESRAGRSERALVGSVEVVSGRTDVHVKRVDPPDDAQIAEGSWWFDFGQACEATKLPAEAIGALCDVRFLSGLDELAACLPPKGGELRLITGAWISDDDRHQISALTGLTPEPEEAGSGWHDSVCGAPISAFLQAGGQTDEYFCHLDRDPDGAYALAIFWRPADRT